MKTPKNGEWVLSVFMYPERDRSRAYPTPFSFFARLFRGWIYTLTGVSPALFMKSMRVMEVTA